jgi:hypothetical protein
MMIVVFFVLLWYTSVTDYKFKLGGLIFAAIAGYLAHMLLHLCGDINLSRMSSVMATAGIFTFAVIIAASAGTVFFSDSLSGITLNIMKLMSLIINCILKFLMWLISLIPQPEPSGELMYPQSRDYSVIMGDNANSGDSIIGYVLLAVLSAAAAAELFFLIRHLFKLKLKIKTFKKTVKPSVIKRSSVSTALYGILFELAAAIKLRFVMLRRRNSSVGLLASIQLAVGPLGFVRRSGESASSFLRRLSKAVEGYCDPDLSDSLRSLAEILEIQFYHQRSYRSSTVWERQGYAARQRHPL